MDTATSLQATYRDVVATTVDLDEGFGGDYDPHSPADRRLWRIDITVTAAFAARHGLDGDLTRDGLIAVDGASTCTRLPVDTPAPVAAAAVAEAAKVWHDAIVDRQGRNAAIDLVSILGVDGIPPF